MKKSLVRNLLHIKPVHMYRLLEWDKGQTPSERLAAIILANEGFRNIDHSPRLF